MSMNRTVEKPLSSVLGRRWKLHVSERLVDVFFFKARSRTPYRRCGYTILELMISLVLLATLSMVAWSILESYRGAEQRAWSQNYQMQVIRVARQWLESDAACLMEPRVLPSSSLIRPQSFVVSSSEMKPFKGDEQGFVVDVIPAADPIAWLAEITRTSEPLTTTTQTHDAGNRNAAIAIDPVAVHRLSYKIASSTNTKSAATTRTGEELFDVQRELIPIDRWSNALSSSASEELLTTSDLYRITDDELPTDSGVVADRPAASIRNLIAPRFRYSDGKEWQTQWDSQLKGGLPRAIELSFDLPSASTEYETPVVEPEDADEFAVNDFIDDVFSSESSAVVDAPTVEVDDAAALTRDVRIVVLVEGSEVQPTTSAQVLYLQHVAAFLRDAGKFRVTERLAHMSYARRILTGCIVQHD